MANQIRLKRASGSDPGASDLVTGEIAVRTDNGKLFTKKDDGSVAEISGGGIDDGDKGDIVVSNSCATFTVDAGVITNAKVSGSAAIAASKIAGLATSATTDTTNASNIGSGTLNTARLPNTYTKAATVTFQATGSGSDVKIDAADHIILESGEEEDGNIYFRGNGGTDSYRFAKSGQTAIEGFLSFQSLSADRTFTFPNTTGTLALTSSDITGNAATATTLATARTIAGVSFNGSANISLNNNAITNGAGYITSSNSAITNKLPLAGGTMTGELQINARLDVGNGSGNDHEIRIYKADNNVSDHIQFYNGTTRVGEIGCEDTSWLRINQETAKNIYTPRYIRADAGFFVDSTSKGINGSGNFIGGTIAGASDYSTLLRSDTADTASGDITFNGGSGAVTIAGNSDIRLTNGTWSGNTTTPKIQAHNSSLYIVGGTSGIVFRENTANRWLIDGSGNFDPATDSTYDIGSNSLRVKVGYFDELDSAEVRVNNGILETKAAIATSHTLATDFNAMSVSPTVNSGVTVTVPSGAVWAIV